MVLKGNKPTKPAVSTVKKSIKNRVAKAKGFLEKHPSSKIALTTLGLLGLVGGIGYLGYKSKK